jgi:hypothetical protein
MALLSENLPHGSEINLLITTSMVITGIDSTYQYRIVFFPIGLDWVRWYININADLESAFDKRSFKTLHDFAWSRTGILFCYKTLVIVIYLSLTSICIPGI